MVVIELIYIGNDALDAYINMKNIFTKNALWLIDMNRSQIGCTSAMCLHHWVLLWPAKPDI